MNWRGSSHSKWNSPGLNSPVQPNFPWLTSQSIPDLFKSPDIFAARSLNLSTCPSPVTMRSEAPGIRYVAARDSQSRHFHLAARNRLSIPRLANILVSCIWWSNTTISTVCPALADNNWINSRRSESPIFRGLIRCSICTRARFASAAACSASAARSSALEARSVTSAICVSACIWARLACRAMKSPIATSAKTPIVTKAFPVTSRCGHILVIMAFHASGPDSISKPMTTNCPAKVSATSRPSSPKPTFISLLIGPFIRRRR